MLRCQSCNKVMGSFVAKRKHEKTCKARSIAQASTVESVPLILYSDGVNAASHGTIMFNTAPVDVGLLSNSNAAQNTHI